MFAPSEVVAWPLCKKNSPLDVLKRAYLTGVSIRVVVIVVVGVAEGAVDGREAAVADVHVVVHVAVATKKRISLHKYI
jgi:hypothetical protein